MKKITYITLLAILLSGMGLTGCNKLIEIGVPKDQLASNSIFTDTSTAEAAVAGMYSIFANGNPGLNTGTATTLYNMLSADEAYCYAYTFYDDFTNNSLTSQTYYVDGYWNGVYGVIYNANAIIEGAPASSLPDSYKGRIAGEAKFIRAICYFYLVNEYGAIPIVTSTNV
ncbi:MAG TPA: RagB/SusD family nutrient uptake outer membrane protein, partial [Puia sp.]